MVNGKVCPKCGGKLEVLDLFNLFNKEIIEISRRVGSTRATARVLSDLYGKSEEAWRSFLRKEAKTLPKASKETVAVIERLSKSR